MDKLSKDFKNPQMDFMFYMRSKGPMEKDFNTIDSDKIKVGDWAIAIGNPFPQQGLKNRKYCNR